MRPVGSWFALPLTLLFALPAGAADFTALNLRAADRHIIPAYQRLAAETEALASTADRFCTAPDAAGLSTLRAAYGAALDGWQGIEHIRFGPVQLLLREHRYALWPDKRGSVGKHLDRLLASRDPQALKPEAFATGSVAVQGFSALERLLFGTESTAKAFAGDADASYRCAVVQTIAHNLADMSRELASEWTQGPEAHRGYFATAAQGNAYYESDREVAGRLLNALHTELQHVSEHKLGRPLGDNIGQGRGRRAESWRSGRSLANIRRNLSALQALYEVAFAPALDGNYPHAALEAGFARALAALDAIPAPLDKAVGEPAGRAAVTQLQSAVNDLQTLVAGPLAEALDLTLGFNSLDGD